ncbi:MAG: TldD/PmbA family protein [Chloroflexi bacterium]|nr:TldD/PmbA family protein [Chloroflexota bacterium]
MLSLADLRRAVKNALAFASSQSDVAEVEVFASAGANLTVRLNYTSHIPSNGVEEPKSTEGYGLGIRATFRTPDGIKTGFGSEPTDLSLEGAARALDKARSGAVSDAEFVSLPKLDSPQRPHAKPDAAEKTAPSNYDPALMRIGGKGLVDAGWRMMDRALGAFQSSEDLMGLAGSAEKMADLGLILGGDVVMLQDRMAIASTHLPRVQTEQNTLVMSFATAMIESQSSKGSGWSVGSKLADFTGEAAAEAARNAIESMDGQRIPTGSYNVVLGPQAVAEILEWVLMPGLSLDSFYAGASPFMGKLGQSVASEDFNLYDDGAAPGLPSSKAITDEGLPTGRTELIREGKLSGLLADYYNYQRILNDPAGPEKLGVAPKDALESIAPRNGFRPGNGGGRDFGVMPSARSSNLVIEGSRGHSQEELLRLVGNGVYIGRIWYTYPVNGTTSGDFSGTIIADSYLIKDGRFSAPLKPNTVRMNDNVLRLINNILGIAAQRRATVRWSSDQVTWAPEIAVAGFGLEEISEYMEGV